MVNISTYQPPIMINYDKHYLRKLCHIVAAYGKPTIYCSINFFNQIINSKDKNIIIISNNEINFYGFHLYLCDVLFKNDNSARAIVIPIFK